MSRPVQLLLSILLSLVLIALWGLLTYFGALLLVDGDSAGETVAGLATIVLGHYALYEAAW